eukprot:TRINITY_DN15641_c0_g1_i1.p1 TRINITY_DN15641_c0_g1~~TRINITY_DN15641_c0_g1_i1.p1  ORF type:complete len:443 (+),score=124.36 TRINITY_DN15641_c0_g1_i1:104-1330(+)
MKKEEEDHEQNGQLEPDSEGEDVESNDEDEEVDIEKKYHMDDYDEEEEEVSVFDEAMNQLVLEEDQDLEEDEEDLDDLTIRPTDAIIVASQTEDDSSTLNIYVYEEAEDNLYVHHDLMMSSFVLSMSWMDYHPTEPTGNLMAIGTFEPEIEIWDLDIMETLTPITTLGGKMKKKDKFLAGSHTNAVMSLSWNSKARNILASGSADNTVKVWDLSKSSCLYTFTHHKGKVQSVLWHPSDAQILLCAAYDQTASLLDARYPNAVGKCALSADIEQLHWDPHHPTNFLAATEDGRVTCYDSRKLSEPIWKLEAHIKTCSALSLNTVVPSYMATGSAEKCIKLWSTEGNAPKLLETLPTQFQVFSASFYTASPFLLCAGGKMPEGTEDSSKSLKIWKTATLANVANHFSKSK